MPKKNFFWKKEPADDNFVGEGVAADDAAFHFDGTFGDMQPLDLLPDDVAMPNLALDGMQPVGEANFQDFSQNDFAPNAPVPAVQEDFFAQQPVAEPVFEAPFFEAQQPAAESGFDAPFFEVQQPAAEPVFEAPFFEAQQPAAEPVFEAPFFEAQQPVAEPGFDAPFFEAQQPAAEPVFDAPFFEAQQPVAESGFDASFFEAQQPAAEPVFDAPFFEAQQPVAEPVFETETITAPVSEVLSQDALFTPENFETMQPDFFAVAPTPDINDVFVPQPNAFVSAVTNDYTMPGDKIMVPEPIVPFDIAEAEAPHEEVTTQPTSMWDPDYVPKRTYKPVFPGPVPSALDELRSGAVRPTSPISDIAATQIPVIITAADAAGVNAIGTHMEEQAPMFASQEEPAPTVQEPAPLAWDFPSTAVEPQPVAVEAIQAIPEAPQVPEEQAAAPEEISYGYDGEIHPNAPQQDPFAAFAQEQAQAEIPQEMAPYTAEIDVEQGAPVADGFTQSISDASGFDVTSNGNFAPMGEPLPQDEFAPQEGFFHHENDGVHTAEQYAQNLQAVLGEDTFAQPQGNDDVFTTQPQPQRNLDLDASREFTLGEDFGTNQAYLGDETDFAQNNVPQDNAFTGDFAPIPDFMMLDAQQEDGFAAPQEPVPQKAFNPFESDEYTGEGDDEDELPPHGRDGKKSSPLILIIVLAVLLLAVVGVALFVLFGKKEPAPSSSIVVPSVSQPVATPAPTPEPTPAVDPIPRDEWSMKLVNKTSVLTADYTVKTAKTSDGVDVDERIVEAMNKMLADAKAQSINLKVVAGYRSYARQEASFKSGLSDAAPGTSEHNLGLSADIQSTKSSNYAATFKDSAEAKWLLENAATYGFILRYPEGKETVTGFAFEPWHYRYVGVDQAQRIKASGLTLEEYLAQDAPTGVPGAATPAPEAAGSLAASPAAASVAAAG